MSFITSAEAAVEKVFRDVETGIKDIDGAALHEARALIGEAKAAEAKAAQLAGEVKAEAESLIVKYGPEVEADLRALAEHIAAIVALFGG